jgi:hypothetical protein
MSEAVQSHPTWDEVNSISPDTQVSFTYQSDNDDKEVKTYTADFLRAEGALGQWNRIIVTNLTMGKDSVDDVPTGFNFKMNGNNFEFYLDRITDFRIIPGVEHEAAAAAAAELEKLECIKDPNYKQYDFGDKNLTSSPLYQETEQNKETMAHMIALHETLVERHGNNRQITMLQCQVLIKQIMKKPDGTDEVSLDALIKYLCDTATGIITDTETKGDVVYTLEKQQTYLAPVFNIAQSKPTATGRAAINATKLQQTNQSLLDNSLYAKGTENDGSIVLSIRPEAKFKNIIILKPDGKIVVAYSREYGALFNMPLSNELVKVEIEMDGINIKNIIFKSQTYQAVSTLKKNISTIGKAMKPKSSWFSSTFKSTPPAAAAASGGGRRTRRKKMASTKKIMKRRKNRKSRK